jgi:hypothetical protein
MLIIVYGHAGSPDPAKGEEVDDSADQVAGRIMAFLEEGPAHFEDILNRFPDVKYRDLLRAWGVLHRDGLLGREFETGKYLPKVDEAAGREDG